MPTLPNAVAWSPVLDESPCDLCPFVARCRDQRLACDQFETFYRFGGRRWRKESREPDAEIYLRVFRGDATAGRPRKPATNNRKVKISAFMLTG